MCRYLGLLMGAVLTASASEPLYPVVREDGDGFSRYADSLITVIVDVTDSRGNGKPGLGADQFTIQSEADTTDLVESAITFEDSERGIAVILCLDISGSMAGAPMAGMTAAVDGYLGMLRPQDRAAIVVIHDSVEKVADFTNDTELLGRTVDGLGATGNYTHLYDAVYQCIGYFSQAPDLPDRQILLVISDGKDEGSVYTEGECIAHADQEGVSIHSIGFALPENVQYLRNMEKLSEQTGGRYFHAEDSGSIDDALLGALSDLMNSSYLVTFRVPGVSYGMALQTYSLLVRTPEFSGECEFSVSPPPESVPAPGEPGTASGQREGLLSGWLIPAAGAAILVVLVVVFLSRRAVSRKEKEFKQRQEELGESLREARKQAQEAEKKAEALGEQPRQDSASAVPEDELFSQRSPEATPEVIEEDPEQSRTGGAPRESRVRADRTMAGDSVMKSYETASLVVVDGSQSGMSFPLEGDEITLGRAGDNRIVLAGDTVSGHHAVIRNSRGFFQITDLGSTNGTFVDGTSRKSAILENGSILKLGSVRLRFEAR